MPEHINNVDEIRRIGLGIRREFFAGAITVADVVEAYCFNHPHASGIEIEEFGEDAKFGLSGFPFEACRIATNLLRRRIGHGVIVDGGYRQTDEDGRVYYAPHEFLDIGKTPLAADTIADIAADQFEGGPALYLGSLQEPWSRSARRPQ